MLSIIKNLYQRSLFFISLKNKNDDKYINKEPLYGHSHAEAVCFALSKREMHLSVLKYQYRGEGWRGNFANALAFAATGDFERSKKAVDYLCNTLQISQKVKFKLALSLAGYLPEVSLSLITDHKSLEASRFKLALLIFFSKDAKAWSLLEQYRDDPVMRWYKINLLASTTNKVKLLNSCLESFSLEPVSLCDRRENLNPCNVSVKKTLPKIVDGPLVSILVTVYCSENYIESAIQSLLNQTYQNIEIVIINDASTDKSEEIIFSLMKRDSRIRYIVMNENVGTFVAKNEGAKQAKGDFITCHDSDDWAHPRKIELQIQPLLNNKRIICSTSQWIRMSNSGQLYARKIYPLIRLNPASPMFRKTLFKKIGYWDSVRTGADSEFLARIKASFGEQMVTVIKKPLTIGYHRANSLMTDESTGYMNGVSMTRLEYWENWNRKLSLEKIINNGI